MIRSVALLSLLAASALAAPLLAATTKLPCPEPKPAFDPAAIDRSLKEPSYGSASPAYRFLAFGPEGKSVIAAVADESKGTGTGYDTLYVDLNANHDLTEPGERFTLEKPCSAKKVPGAANTDLVLLSITGWGKLLTGDRKLAIADPTFDYMLSFNSSFQEVVTSTKDGSWKVRMVASDGPAPWSTSRAEAPVFRYGGPDFSLRNENFILVPTDRGYRRESGVGRTLRPGTQVDIDGAIPFFAGSSPSAVFAQATCWVPGGVRGLSAWVETGADAGTPQRTELDFHEY
jgi:hypothetical protein